VSAKGPVPACREGSAAARWVAADRPDVNSEAELALTVQTEAPVPPERTPHTNALCPVIARPTMSVFISRVPSYE
jgi:hypothetical protein